MIGSFIRNLFIYGFFIFFSFFVSGQNSYKISGKVIDEEKLLLSGASVKLTDKNDSVVYATQSNEDGMFQIGKVRTGKYKLAITMIGRITQTEKVVLKDKDIVNLEIELPFDYKNTLPEANILAKRRQYTITKIAVNLPQKHKELLEEAHFLRSPQKNTERLQKGTSEILKDKCYDYDKYVGKWQWQSDIGDTVLTVLLRNIKIETRIDIYIQTSMPGAKNFRTDFLYTDLLVGWYELKVKDSILFSNIDTQPKITSFSKFDEVQKQCLIGLFEQINPKKVVHFTLRKNPLGNAPRGFLVFTLLGDKENYALWNLSTMVKNTLNYAIIEKPLPGEFVLPTKVVMKKISNE